MLLLLVAMPLVGCLAVEKQAETCPAGVPERADAGMPPIERALDDEMNFIQNQVRLHKSKQDGEDLLKQQATLSRRSTCATPKCSKCYQNKDPEHPRVTWDSPRGVQGTDRRPMMPEEIQGIPKVGDWENAPGYFTLPGIPGHVPSTFNVQQQTKACFEEYNFIGSAPTFYRDAKDLEEFERSEPYRFKKVNPKVGDFKEWMDSAVFQYVCSRKYKGAWLSGKIDPDPEVAYEDKQVCESCKCKCWKFMGADELNPKKEVEESCCFYSNIPPSTVEIAKRQGCA